MGLCYYKDKDYKSAIEAYNKAIFFDPSYAYAYIHRGSAYEMLRQMEDACADWKKARDLGLEVAKEYCSVCKEY
jgi:tetratricopeptide (TPR) repeat protein